MSAIPHSYINFLRKTVPKDDIINLLISTNNLDDIHILSNLYFAQIEADNWEKLDVPLNYIYNEKLNNTIENTNLEVEVLSGILKITKNFQTFAKPAAEHLFNLQNVINQAHILRRLKLLNVFFQFFHFELKLDTILETIDNHPAVNNFICSTFLPTYLHSNPDSIESQIRLLFAHVRKNRNLLLLCTTYKHLHHLYDDPHFWRLLAESITGAYALQKQAQFLIAKSTSIIFDARPPQLPPHVQAGPNLAATKQTWRNFHLLLDASNEKQLHLVRPSLALLQTLAPLHRDWKGAVFRVLVTHSQSFVCFYTACHVLRADGLAYVDDFLRAANQHDFSPVSRLAFAEFRRLAASLSEAALAPLIARVQAVAWTPAGLARVFDALFAPPSAGGEFSVRSLEALFALTEACPHLPVRRQTRALLAAYVRENFTGKRGLDDLLRIASLLQDANDLSIRVFVHRNAEQFETVFTETNFARLMKSDCKLCIKIGKLLALDDIQTMASFITGSALDSYFNAFSYAFERDYLERYVFLRLKSIEEEEACDFVLLARRFCSEMLYRLSSDLLKDASTPLVQKVVAFNVIEANFKPESREIADFYATNIFGVENFKTSANLIAPFIRVYSKVYLGGNVDLEGLQVAASIFCNILQQYPVDSVFVFLENITPFLNSTDLTASRFFSLCLKELAELKSNAEFCTTVRNLLKQVFDNHQVDNDAMVTFLKFCLADTSNAIQLIVAQEIRNYTVKSDFSCGNRLICLLCELILRASLVRKSDRLIVENICMEASLDGQKIRLYALHALLHIAEANQEHADQIGACFQSEYESSFKKRYFPDSQLHLKKLRIMQAFLTFYTYFSEEQTEKLTNFLTECLVEENHQMSVHHLIQALYINLIKSNEKRLDVFLKKFDDLDECKPNTVLNFIIILFHVAKNHESDEFILKTIKSLIPYTMGAQFKLRIYTQMALLKLLDDANSRKRYDLVKQFTYLYDSLATVVEATSASFKGFDQIDKNFLLYFDISNINYETIYTTIPKETDVMHSEWSTKLNDSKITELNFDLDVENIQKKITPWRDFFEEDRIANSLVLVTSLVEKSANLGGLSRTCEVFGVKQFVTKTAKVRECKEFKSLSMSSEHWLDMMEVKLDDLKAFFEEIKRKGYSIVGAEQTSNSIDLNTFQFPKSTVLVLGNEKEGISPDLIPLLDYCVEIPQIGLIRSLNVHVAGAILIWEYCKQHIL